MQNSNDGIHYIPSDDKFQYALKLQANILTILGQLFMQKDNRP